MLPLDFPISKVNEPLRVSGKYFCTGDDPCFLKVVTFGPFPAGSFPDEGRAQLVRIREELGANAIRLYEIPTLDFMHSCAENGLRVFLTLPWSQHIDFFRNSEAIVEADRLLLETIQKFRGHPALAGYFVGNEIESTLVRWMGRKQVLEQIERLIELGHANDPNVLFSYANYPSTEYLLPRNQDFVAFNLYLEDQSDFSAYLLRLQNLAGDKPVLISEFGADSRQHGEPRQAEILEWHVREACKTGIAGTTVFAWSDLWQRGGKTIDGYDFGLTRRDHSAKPSLENLKQTWGDLCLGSDLLEIDPFPKISVIICTYKGSETLVECLNSVTSIDYPDYEVILVNDGKDLRVAELSEEYNTVRHIASEHVGLSTARNLGARAASGEILAYTDDDCIVEPDWLRWIAHQFQQSPSIGCVGGPNIPPPPETRRQACIAASPGGPAHVLLSDTTAEHLPGCNLTVRKSVFEEVGGFDRTFWAAGDDVDFCWRILDAGYDLAFQPSAFVWHHRRFTLPAYLKQQIGYGKAEALLMPMHPKRFRGLGGAVWNGRVYTSQLIGEGVVYHGHYGYEPYQLIYPDSGTGLGGVCLHVLWWGTALLLSGLAWVSPWFLMLPGVMAVASLLIALKRGRRAPLPPSYQSAACRMTVSGLSILQGFFRSGARVFYGWKDAKWSRGLEVITTAAFRRISSAWWKFGAEECYWSEEGVGRDEFLARVREEYPMSRDDETGRTDIILRDDVFWNWALLTATEYHEGKKRLTRARVLSRPQPVTRALALVLFFSSLIAIGLVFRGGFSLEQGDGILLVAIGVVSVVAAMSRLFLRFLRPRIKSAALACGLERFPES